MNMTNRDAAINSTIDHLANVGATFLGFSAGPATKALIKVVANNYIQNSKYGQIFDAFFDQEGNFLTDKDTYFTALKEFMSQKPLEIAGFRFNHKDVDEISKLFDKYK